LKQRYVKNFYSETSAIKYAGNDIDSRLRASTTGGMEFPVQLKIIYFLLRKILSNNY